MRGDPSHPPSLSIGDTANVLGTSLEHVGTLLDHGRIAYETTATSQRRILRSELDAHRRRQGRAHDAMRESMLSAEALADDV